MSTKFRRSQCALWGLVLCLTFCSCRIHVPSASDGQHLIEQGKFVGEVPPWIRQDEKDRSTVTASAGIVPQRFSAPPPVKITRAAVPGPDVNPVVIREENARARLVEKEGEGAADDEVVTAEEGEGVEEEVSPLERIEETCPGIESSVVEALQTTDVAQRIRKYSTLTSRCPHSWDLWLWLGKDYQSQGRMVEAGRCYERVLTLDYSNEVARALLAVVRKNLNEGAFEEEEETPITE